MIQLQGYQQSDSILVTSGAGEIVIISFPVPPKMVLKIRQFSNSWGTLATWPNAVWSMYRSGSPVPELYSRKDQFGTLNQPYTFSEPIVFTGGQLLEVRAAIFAGPNDNASVGLWGGLYG